jgi:hypothetical protein
MRMGGLWNAFARFCVIRQEITVDDSNVMEVIAQNTSREQSADTGPKYDGR